MDRELVVRNLARVRRAQRRHADDADLAAVRLDLERSIAPTLGRAASARLLDVSQTALDRWIAIGEIPVVMTPMGRREVPVGALLDLLDGLERRTEPERHPLAAILRERRNDATLTPPAAPPSASDTHRTAELRGLAYHRAVAERLDTATISEALARVRRWRSERRIHPHYADEWEQLLSGPPTRLIQLICQDDERAAALRQSSPLAGMLQEGERRRLLGLASPAPR